MDIDEQLKKCEEQSWLYKNNIWPCLQKTYKTDKTPSTIDIKETDDNDSVQLTLIVFDSISLESFTGNSFNTDVLLQTEL